MAVRTSDAGYVGPVRFPRSELEKIWCREHRPKSDVCSNPMHGLRWLEMHDEELKDKYDISAVFYCQVLGCDEFECVPQLDYVSAKRNITDYFITKYSGSFKDILLGSPGVAYELCINAVRLKILLYKLALREGDEK